MERRSYKRVGAPEVRSGDGGELTLTGYTAVFESFSQNLGGFIEIIDRSFFDDVIDSTDVVALFNHDPSEVLGSTSNRTVRLSVDHVGLRYEVAVNPADSRAMAVAEKVRRGDVRGSSFQFDVPADGSGVVWGLSDQGFPVRRLLRCAALYDVGPVTFPAYKATEESGLAAAVRSLASSVSVDELIVAARSGQLAKYLPVSNTGSSDDTTGEIHAVDLSSYRRQLLRQSEPPFRV